MQAPRASSSKLLLLLLLVCVLPDLGKGDADSDLVTLQEDFFEWVEKMWPYVGTEAGNRAYNDRVDNLSIEVFDTQRAGVREFLTTASTIDRKQLSGQHRYSYDVLLDTLSVFPNNYRWRNYDALNPINFLEPFYLDPAYRIQPMPFENKADFENFIARLQAWPTQIDQMMARMNKSIELRTTYHNVSVRAVPGQISAVINMSVEDTPFYGPFKDKLDNVSLSQAERDSIRSRARDAVDSLWTALSHLKAYMEDIYMPNTRTTYGVGGLPDGKEYYKACLKWHLSVDMSPEEVHQTGLREVDRITQLMRKVMTKQGFSGNVSEYYAMLNADPRFQLNTAEEIIQCYDDLIHNEIYPKLPPLFKNIPDLPVVVRAMPYDGAGGTYSSGSEDGTRPGVFHANVMRPNDTKTFTMPSLALHETVPGHHMTSIYSFAAKLPNFQKYFPYNYYTVPYEIPYYTAYEEGWALYAEFLGEEMGVYKDDYELMGRYGDEMLRAVRLVVDTGMHYLNWTRETAIRYLKDRTPMSLPAVEIEIDRYLTWPGQACAYKIGELKIKELRKKAAAALGSNFDIRDFHLALLTRGKLPLSVMETVVDDYIADNATGAAAHVRCLSVSGVAMYLLTSLMIAVIYR